MYHKIIGGMKKKKQKNILKSVEYLLREKNPEEQKHVIILSGSKNDIINFNKNSINEKKENPYVCGVLSFEEEKIDQDLKIKIITDFEDLLFKGIEPENRPPVLWVEHNDKGRIELNYLTLNQLQDKRAYTVYYDKSDRKLVNLYSEIINYENNLSSPFEERDHRNTLINKPKNDTPQEKKDFINNLNNHILALIINGELLNREETIKYIESIEGVKINRIRKDRISIKCDTFKDDKPLVLRGDIYEENRDYRDYQREYTATINRDPKLIESKLAEFTREYKSELDLREAKNRKRYKNPPRENGKINKKILRKKNRILKHEPANNNINITNNNNSITTHYNNNIDIKEVNNDFINGKNKIKNEREKPERPRSYEEIDFQQQFIHQRIKELGGNQQQNRRTIERVEERLGICRRSLHGFIRFLEQLLRPAQIYSRRKEIQEKIGNKLKKAFKTQEIKNTKRNDHRRRYTPF